MWFCRCVALLGVLCWCFCVSAQFQCLPQRSTALKFSMTSKRNQTGHWKAQVRKNFTNFPFTEQIILVYMAATNL